MNELFIKLSQNEQLEILETLSHKLGRSALQLEKDVWLCYVLQYLFTMPNHLPMAFKGGTSLSKIFRAICRFSEDLDITIDYQAFNCIDPFDEKISKTRLKTLSDQIKKNVTAYLKKVILPYFEGIALAEFDNTISAELANDGETIFIYYPSVLDKKSQYIENSIRLEFGGRNTSLPNISYQIQPDISEHVTGLTFPTANVVVLSPYKTFWEKITLIHYECKRSHLRKDAHRISRHWYDIAMLYDHNIGKQAINDIHQLKEVIKIKKTFYNSNYAQYDDCLNGKLQLIPDDESFVLLQKDFEKMIEEKMFYSNPPSFNSIIRTMKNLEQEINLFSIRYDLENK